nr:heavy metal-associated domain, HMA [Tanacetum cinerariifolium]
LVAHLAPFWKVPEPFLCLVGMSRYYTLDEDTYPSFLRDDETDMDLFAFIQVMNPTKVNVVERGHAEGEAKLLDSTVGRVVSLLPVAPARAENVAAVTAERPRRQRKKRPAVTNASASSHTPMKLRGDYGTSSGAATGGKSMFVLKELLASSILNVKVGV